MTTTVRIGAVIVTFFPDEDTFNRLSVYSSFFKHLVIVDNTPTTSKKPFECLERYKNIKIIQLGDNKGIATAINIGVNYLIQQKCEYFFLFDQDSHIKETLVNDITAQFKTAHKKTAQIGPAYFDTRLKKIAPFIQINGLRITRQPAIGNHLITADYLITSGACISLAAWEAIGGMDESLFIDYVDIEWGLRAKSKGWISYGFPGVVMQHCLGDEPIKILGRLYPVHSPVRHYYLFRNTIKLMRRSYIPINWKLIELYRLILKAGAYTIFTKNKMQHIKMITKGIRHGICNRSGRIDNRVSHN